MDLGDIVTPRRLELLLYLARKKSALAREIETETAVKERSLLCYHLRRLRDLGLVYARRTGLETRYELTWKGNRLMESIRHELLAAMPEPAERLAS